MRLRHLAVLVLLLVPRQAAASSLTIENVWPYEMTSFSLWADNWRLLSSDQGPRPENYLDVPITAADPLLGFSSLTITLPDSLAHGFTYGGLTMGGPLPGNSGYSVGDDRFFAGDWISDGAVFEALWPATDGSLLEILRVTYRADPVVQEIPPASEIPTPEPASLALLAVGGAVVAWRRRHLRTTGPSIDRRA
jgi:hypothetical protein